MTSPRTLAVAGASIGALLGVFVLLFANVPAGLNAVFGLHLPAVAIFARQWPYPTPTLSPRGFAALYCATLLALWGAYFVAAGAAKRLEIAQGTRRAAGVILAFAFFYNLFLVFFLPPVLSGDVFHYALFGRMVAWHGANPYLATANLLRQDEFFALTLWRDIATPYGPSWSIVSAMLATLGGESVLLTLLAFKGLAAGFNLIGALLVLALARQFRCESPARAMLYYAWNPLILIESAGSAHNDAVMVAIALFGVLLAARGRMLLGLAAIVVSALVKYLTFLLVPFYVAFCLSRRPRRHAVRLAARMALVGGVVIVLLYAPFVPEPSRLTSLLPGFTPSFNPAPNPLLIALQRAAAVATSTPIDARPLMALLFGALVVVQIRWATRGDATWASVLGHYGWATLVYAYLVFGSALPWYLVSPLAAAAVAPETGSNRWLLPISAGLGLVLFVYGYVPLRPV